MNRSNAQFAAVGIRKYHGTLNSGFDGDMDNMALWSEPLSAAEIQDLYELGPN